MSDHVSGSRLLDKRCSGAGVGVGMFRDRGVLGFLVVGFLLSNLLGFKVSKMHLMLSERILILYYQKFISCLQEDIDP